MRALHALWRNNDLIPLSIFMRALLIICSLVFSTFPGRCVQSPEDTLRFYVVSDKLVAGGRYVDTPECPKVGYISDTPNLVISRLKSVSTNSLMPAVEIQMFEPDAQRFAEITRRHLGQRILFSLGARPLMAPSVQMPIENGKVEITVGNGGDIQGIFTALKKFEGHE